MRVVLHPEAHSELRAAAFWYDEQRPGLGDEFVRAIEEMLGRIGEFPSTFQVWPGTQAAPCEIRRAVALRFPYVIAFGVLPDRLLVLAIAHARRRPLYWLTRAF